MSLRGEMMGDSFGICTAEPPHAPFRGVAAPLRYWNASCRLCSAAGSLRATAARRDPVAVDARSPDKNRGRSYRSVDGLFAAGASRERERARRRSRPSSTCINDGQSTMNVQMTGSKLSKTSAIRKILLDYHSAIGTNRHSSLLFLVLP